MTKIGIGIVGGGQVRPDSLLKRHSVRPFVEVTKAEPGVGKVRNATLREVFIALARGTSASARGVSV